VTHPQQNVPGARPSRQGTGELPEVRKQAKEPRKVIAEFSIGMCKRLAMAAALIHLPELLSMDEPFEGVDGRRRQGFVRTSRLALAPGTSTSQIVFAAFHEKLLTFASSGKSVGDGERQPSG
jgi:ABC-type molybdenum transport system ATPase subunit/photorepair protein PhrA